MTLTYGLRGTDVVGDFCDAIGLGTGMCDFLRAVFDQLGIDPNNLEDELRQKGKAKLCGEIVDLIGVDFPGGAKAARDFCDSLLTKIEQRVTGGTASPRAPRDFTTQDLTRGLVATLPLGPGGVEMAITSVPESQVLPRGTIATNVPAESTFRVAVPAPPTAGDDSKFVEVVARGTIPQSVLQVQLRDFLRLTGQLPLYKDPIFWAIVAGTTTVVGGLLYVRHRRSKAR